MRKTAICVALCHLLASAAMAATPALDERLAGDDEWGFRPAPGAVSEAMQHPARWSSRNLRCPRTTKRRRSSPRWKS